MFVSPLEHTQHEIVKILGSSREIFQQQKEIAGKIIDLLTTRDIYFNQIHHGINPEILRKNYSEQSDYYKQQQEVYENHPQGEGNPAWIQLNCYVGLKPVSGINIKIYRSIPIREYAFLTHLGKLKGLLETLSEETGDCISFKFPRGFVGFLKHRDSLVVHFQKKENIDRINQILDTWMKENSITREKREDNRSEVAVDHSNMSFSELIAVNFAYHILKNPDQLNSLLKDAIIKSQSSNIVPV